MKLIATVTGPLKKYVGKIFFQILQIDLSFFENIGRDVLVTKIRWGTECPIEPQVWLHSYFSCQNSHSID